MQNITNIPAPRVDFIDPRTGLMSREWYRFFLNLFQLTGSGTNSMSLTDVQVGPDINAVVSRYDELSKSFDPTTYCQPLIQVGTLAQQNADRVTVGDILVGDAGTEGTGIDVGGTVYNSTFKVSDIDGTNYAQTILHRHSTTNPPVIVAARSNSDTAAHADVTASQQLFANVGCGWAGNNYKIFGFMTITVDSTGTVSNTSAPGRWQFHVTPDASVVPALAFTITNDKKATFESDLTTKGKITTLGGATFHTTSSALTNGAGAGAGTITNAPSAGNPTKWIGIDDNGTTRYIPAW